MTQVASLMIIFNGEIKKVYLAPYDKNGEPSIKLTTQSNLIILQLYVR